MAVKKIKLGAVEGNLRTVSSSAETIKRLQDEKEALMREHGRERRRYTSGEIARDVFSSLTRAHKRKVVALDRRIAALEARSKSSLTTLTALVAGHAAGKKKRRRKIKAIKKKAKKRKKVKKKKKAKKRRKRVKKRRK